MIPWDSFATPQDAYEWAKKVKIAFYIMDKGMSAWYVALDLGLDHMDICVLPKRWSK